MRKRILKPSKGWYWVGLLVLVAGVGYGSYVIGSALGGMLRSRDRKVFDLPGQGTIRLEQPGTYPIWLSRPKGAYSGEDEDPPVPVPGVDVRLTLTDADGNAPIAVAKPFGNLNLDMGEFSMVLMGTFDVTKATTVRIEAEPIPEGSVGRDLSMGRAQVAITRTDLSGLLANATRGLLVALISLVTGMLVIVVTAIRRSRDSRRRFEEDGREEPASMETSVNSAGPPPA